VVWTGFSLLRPSGAQCGTARLMISPAASASDIDGSCYCCIWASTCHQATVPRACTCRMVCCLTYGVQCRELPCLAMQRNSVVSRLCPVNSHRSSINLLQNTCTTILPRQPTHTRTLSTCQAGKEFSQMLWLEHQTRFCYPQRTGYFSAQEAGYVVE
jgi:hypothetical protein